MVRKVAALSNLVCRILIHPTSLPSYVIGLASLLLAGRAPRTNNFLDPSAVLLTSIHGLVGQQHLISHSESGSSGRLLWSARNKDQSREILKSACCSNKGTQFQIKDSISDGALRVTDYDSRGFVPYNFIFHVADPGAYTGILKRRFHYS